MPDIRCRRIYDEPARSDGTRVLVDRLWPRGVSKEEARLDDWIKDAAPSDGLREWFDHDPERWQRFRQRYFDELDDREETVAHLCELAADGRLTLLYAAKDEQHNNAIALRDYLRGRCG